MTARFAGNHIPATLPRPRAPALKVFPGSRTSSQVRPRQAPADVDDAPEPLPYDPQRAQEIIGHYENEFITLIIDTDGDTMTVECRIKPEIRTASERELPPDLPPAGLGLLSANGDEYIVTGGGLIGQRGFLTRDADGAITGADLAGRLFNRAPIPAE
ncbi:hypothetical protein [Streptomyces sp. NPDC058295]|uniref:hypothetical protein n=1 Tax=Streptomyces sp. NPDC058295 TaxID=3346431 RepID=UPI0036E31630